MTEIMAAVGVKPDSIGCETCKPAVGSILSSLWNEHIVDPVHNSWVTIWLCYEGVNTNQGVYAATRTRTTGEVSLQMRHLAETHSLIASSLTFSGMVSWNCSSTNRP